MAKHAEAIRLSVFDHCVGLALNGLKMMMLKLARKILMNDDSNDRFMAVEQKLSKIDEISR